MTYQKITIPLDHGNRNMKTAEEVFTSGLVESDLKPVLGEYLQYNGKYYSLTGERIPYMRDKTLDDRFFILTLFGIGKELERRTQPQKDTIYQVELPVGLPPKHYGALFGVVAIFAVILAIQSLPGTVGGRSNSGLSCASLSLRDAQTK